MSDSNTNGSGNVTEGQPMPEWIRVTFGVGLSLEVIFTVLGNCVVLLSFMRDAQLRIPRFFYIFNLCLCDTIRGILIMPMAAYDMVKGGHNSAEEGSPWYCTCGVYTSYTLFSESALSVILISWDRYLMVRNPLNYMRNETNIKTGLKIGLTWIISLAWNAVTVLLWHYIEALPDQDQYDICESQYEKSRYIYLFSVVEFLIPVLIVGGFSLATFLRIAQATQIRYRLPSVKNFRRRNREKQFHGGGNETSLIQCNCPVNSTIQCDCRMTSYFNQTGLTSSSVIIRKISNITNRISLRNQSSTHHKLSLGSSLRRFPTKITSQPVPGARSTTTIKCYNRTVLEKRLERKLGPAPLSQEGIHPSHGRTRRRNEIQTNLEKSVGNPLFQLRPAFSCPQFLELPTGSHAETGVDLNQNDNNHKQMIAASNYRQSSFYQHTPAHSKNSLISRNLCSQLSLNHQSIDHHGDLPTEALRYHLLPSTIVTNCPDGDSIHQETEFISHCHNDVISSHSTFLERQDWQFPTISKQSATEDEDSVPTTVAAGHLERATLMLPDVEKPTHVATKRHQSLCPRPSEADDPSNLYLRKSGSSVPCSLRKIGKSLAFLVGLYALCWIPNSIVLVIGRFCNGCVPITFKILTAFITYLDPALNPIVYGLSHKRFAKNFREIATCRFKKRRR